MNHKAAGGDSSFFDCTHMLFKLDDGSTCDSTTKGRIADSWVHRFHNAIGFCNNDDETSSNTMAAEARAHFKRHKVGENKSQNQTVERWARVERFFMANFSNGYGGWLLSLDIECTTSTGPITFKAPNVSEVVTFIYHLRGSDQERPLHQAGTIKAYLASITSVCAKFGVISPCASKEITDIMKTFVDQDGYETSASFNFTDDLPTLWASIWYISYWNPSKMVMVWTMFLVSICMMGRASDITTFCPMCEHIKLPPAHLWKTADGRADGLPPYITISLMDWKWRRRCNKNKPYAIKLHRNFLDSRFCPVFWLLFYLADSGITSGPLFQDMKDGKYTGKALSPDQWVRMTTRLFTVAGLYVPAGKLGTFTGDDSDSSHSKPQGCTNHSIRKSALQWAGRCLAVPIDAKNNGRWKSWDVMARYFGQGVAQRAEYTEGGRKDPIFKMWVWKPVTTPGHDGRDQM